MNGNSSMITQRLRALTLAVASLTWAASPAHAGLLDMHHIDLQINFDNPGSQISPMGGFNNGLVIDEGGSAAFPGQKDQYGQPLGQAGFYRADTQQIAVNSQSIDYRPSSPAYDFIGTAAGGAYYHLQQADLQSVQNYAGFAGDDLNPSLFGAWNTHDARAPFNPNPDPFDPVANKWMQINLVSLLGPASGHLSVWDSPTTAGGDPTVWFSSDVGATDANNKFFITAGTSAAHHHTNWGFTEAGTYQMQIDVTTTLADGTLTTGGLTTYTFVVGNAAVPEPASLGMMASGLVMIAAWRIRRRIA